MPVEDPSASQPLASARSLRNSKCARRLLALSLIAFASTPADARPAQGEEPPFNVLFIIVDQQNVNALSVHGNGFGGVDRSLTPNLDRLAQEGVRFDNAICSSPQCCPSRYSVLTGRWPHNHGLRWNRVWEPRTEVTFPTLARSAGYATATVGKHHLYWLDQPTPLMEDHGFDLIRDLEHYDDFCVLSGVRNYTTHTGSYFMPGLPPSLWLTGYSANANEFHPAGYWADQVIDFIESQEQAATPFVCWYSMVGPHAPILPSGPADPNDWAHKYHPFEDLELPPNLNKVATTSRLASRQAAYAGMSEAQHREVLSYYYGYIAQIDYNIGRVLDRLDELGIADRTLVIYTADHGEMASEMSCWAKGTGSYDAVTRVPLIARLPGVFPAGKVVSEPVNGVDLFPTMVELTGVPVPDAVRQRVDGRSLVPLLEAGPAPADWPGETFSEFGLGSEDSKRHRMVRTSEAKFSFDERGGGVEEYYDLKLDPFEINDLLAAGGTEPSGATDLRARLDGWWNAERGHAPIYTLAGDETAIPALARDPRPEHRATDVPSQIDPTWLPSTASDSQRIWLGSDPQSLSLFTTVGPMVSTFNPGSLALATTYYWRVDGVNDNGVSTGPVFQFTTLEFGPQGPGLATAPVPLHLQLGAATTAPLMWSTPGDGDSQRVLLGLAGDLQVVASGLGPAVDSFDPGTLIAGTRYEWRVDRLGPSGSTEGDVWAFETHATGLAERASQPAPKHMASRVPPIQPLILRWVAGRDAESHDVYLGTEFPLEFIGNRTGSEISVGHLESGATYYWRVDEVNRHGRTVGFTWRFNVTKARNRNDPQ